jgi:tetratricopeptide (TPR) repeat protein
LAGKAGKKDVELKYLAKAAEKATSADALLRLGDLLTEKKSWKEAAERYRQAWAKDKSAPLPLLLHGRALVGAGQEAEGKKAIEVAHQLPLGNEYARYQFAKALAERNLPEDARRERELTLKVGALEGWAINETLRMSGYEAQQQKDYGRAADIFEQFRLRCLRMGVSFVDYSAHVQVPSLVHQNRARALAAGGKFDEAKKEWQLCLALIPGNVNIPIYLLPELEKAGRKQEADDLYNGVFKVNEQACKDYPKSANNHNNLAWLAVVCKRQLELAEEHASEAVRLAPGNAGYLDTLAEVNFQRGRQAKAIELMKQCIKLDGKFDYFRKQLKRFEAGDPKAEVPDEGQ